MTPRSLVVLCLVLAGGLLACGDKPSANSPSMGMAGTSSMGMAGTSSMGAAGMGMAGMGAAGMGMAGMSGK